jgi:hypothetical protein
VFDGFSMIPPLSAAKHVARSHSVLLAMATVYFMTVIAPQWLVFKLLLSVTAAFLVVVDFWLSLYDEPTVTQLTPFVEETWLVNLRCALLSFLLTYSKAWDYELSHLVFILAGFYSAAMDKLLKGPLTDGQVADLKLAGLMLAAILRLLASLPTDVVHVVISGALFGSTVMLLHQGDLNVYGYTLFLVLYRAALGVGMTRIAWTVMTTTDASTSGPIVAQIFLLNALVTYNMTAMDIKDGRVVINGPESTGGRSNPMAILLGIVVMFQKPSGYHVSACVAMAIMLYANGRSLQRPALEEEHQLLLADGKSDDNDSGEHPPLQE